MRCRGLRSFHSSWCLNNWSCLHFWILGDDWLSGILSRRQLLFSLLSCSLSISFLSSLFFLGESFFVSQPFGFLLLLLSLFPFLPGLLFQSSFFTKSLLLLALLSLMSCLRLSFSDLLVLGRYLCPFVFLQALVFNVRLVSFELFLDPSGIKVIIKADSHHFVSLKFG